MDISPAPPTATFAFNPLPASFVSSNVVPSRPSLSTSSSSAKPFDNSFFAKLTANQPSSSTGIQRSRTRSADVQPLAAKDANEQSTTMPSFPLKRPTGLLRTASAAAKTNPFEVSPRFPGAIAPPTRPGMLERARSDGGMVFGATATGQQQAGNRNSFERRAPSGLGREGSSGVTRPAPGPYPLQQASSGRRISGRSVT